MREFIELAIKGIVVYMLVDMTYEGYILRQENIELKELITSSKRNTNICIERYESLSNDYLSMKEGH